MVFQLFNQVGSTARNACLGAAGPLAPRCGAFGEDGDVFGASGGSKGGVPVLLRRRFGAAGSCLLIGILQNVLGEIGSNGDVRMFPKRWWAHIPKQNGGIRNNQLRRSMQHPHDADDQLRRLWCFPRSGASRWVVVSKLKLPPLINSGVLWCCWVYADHWGFVNNNQPESVADANWQTWCEGYRAELLIFPTSLFSFLWQRYCPCLLAIDARVCRHTSQNSLLVLVFRQEIPHLWW